MKVVHPIYTGGSYNIIQTVYRLSRFSGLGDSVEGTASHIATKLTTLIDDALSDNSQELGVWTRVWGPCVYQTDKDCTGQGRVSKVADNVMYVAYNTQADCYVVAVAGTNGNRDGSHNWYDTDCLDNNVGTLVGFPMGITPTNSTNPSVNNVGNVSLGAAMGTTNLLNMQDTQTGKSLQSFLADKVSNQSTLIFAGHSLGASLSPTLARWLFTSVFDVARWSAVYVLPTAAPTTGDPGFVNAFSAIFTPTYINGIQTYGFWNQVIWNKYDVVPHGWINLMNVLPYTVQNDVVWDYVANKSVQTLYGPLTGGDADATYNTINNMYQLLPSPIPYARLPSQMFTPSHQPPKPKNYFDFLSTVGKEHIDAYDTFFGVPATNAQLKVSLTAAEPTSTPEAKRQAVSMRNTA